MIIRTIKVTNPAIAPMAIANQTGLNLIPFTKTKAVRMKTPNPPIIG